MEENTESISLRDTIAAQVDALEELPEQTSTAAPAPSPESSVLSPEDSAAQTAGDKPGRTAGRARDEAGRLLPGKAEIPSQVPQAAKPGAVASPTAVTPVAEPAAQRPMSWKPEVHALWDQIPAAAQKYIAQRESEMGRGIAPLQQEIERSRPIVEAMNQFAPLLQQNGIQPGTWITNLGNAHKLLATGSPQDKLGMFVKLAQDYKIPLEQMFERGQDGQVYMRDLKFTPQQQQPDVNQLIETKLIEREAKTAAQQFIEAKDAAGNPAHPHFETVRQSMQQLLEAGIAIDLQGAYDAALRLPQHSQIYDALQQQKTAADEAKKQEELAARAGVARRAAVQVKGGAPRSTANSDTPKGLRGHIESAFEAHIPGRV